MLRRVCVHTLFVSIVLLSCITWLLSLWMVPTPMDIRSYVHEAFFITGLISWGLMSCIMVLSARTPLLTKLTYSPLDQIYRAHKYWGIVAGLLALIHWACKPLFLPLLTTLFSLEPPGDISALANPSWLEKLWQWSRYPANDLAIIFTTLLCIGIVLSLIPKLSYSRWLITHRLFPIFYLFLVPHSLRLMDLEDYANPMGWLNLAFTAWGTWYAIMILRHKAGYPFTYPAKITAIEHHGQCTRLTMHCPSCPAMPAGSFCFAGPDKKEMHPFSVVNQTGNEITLWIKELGDFTRDKVPLYQIGQTLFIEGPWGNFHPNLQHSKQLWCATGIGIAPFMAWLQKVAEIKKQNSAIPFAAYLGDPHTTSRQQITLVWWVRDPQKEASRIAKVEQLAKNAQIHLQIIHRKEKEFHLQDFGIASYRNVAVCGSSTLLTAIQKENPKHIQYEYFSWR